MPSFLMTSANSMAKELKAESGNKQYSITSKCLPCEGKEKKVTGNFFLPSIWSTVAPENV